MTVRWSLKTKSQWVSNNPFDDKPYSFHNLLLLVSFFLWFHSTVLALYLWVSIVSIYFHSYMYSCVLQPSTVHRAADSEGDLLKHQFHRPFISGTDYLLWWFVSDTSYFAFDFFVGNRGSNIHHFWKKNQLDWFHIFLVCIPVCLYRYSSA